jgi:hypothetical protein
MADEYDDDSYTPNDEVIGAVQASTRPDVVATAPVSDMPRPVLRSKKAMAQLAATSAHNAALESVARARLALEASKTYYEVAKTRNAMVQQARDFQHAGNFLAQHANLDPNDPNYYSHVNALAARYPGAASNDAVKIILANPKLREQAVMKGDAPGEVATRMAIQKGFVTANDLKNPELYNSDGNLNHKLVALLADTRQGQSIEPPHIKEAMSIIAQFGKEGLDRSPEEDAIYKGAVNRVAQYQAAKNQTLGVAQPQVRTTASLFPRAVAPNPSAGPQQVSIPKAVPPPTPAPTPVSPEELRKKYLEAALPSANE